MHMRKFTLGLVVGTSLLCGSAWGQQKTAQTPVRSSGYDVKREGTIVGTVLAYTPSSTTLPLGAHVTLQTTGGVVDVHLGNARLLTANHFDIQAGDTLRIIGENVASGSAAPFLARIVQKGTQALTVRTERGIPVRYLAPGIGGESKSQGGAL